MRIEPRDRATALSLTGGHPVPDDLIPHLRDRAAGKPPTNPIAASLSPEQARAILDRSAK